MPGRNSPIAPGPLPVPLIAHSAYSLGRGTATIDALTARARDIGLDALALTDRDNLYGAVAFLKAAAAAGLHPILGAEVSPRTGPPVPPGEESARGAPRGPCRPIGAVVLLIGEPAGYASLCRILTARHLAPEFELVQSILRHPRGLRVLVREPSLLDRLHEGLPPQALYAAIVRPAADHAAERALRQAAARLGRPLVGTIDAYLGTPEEWDTHRVLSAIREVELVSRIPSSGLAHPGCHLASPAEIFDLFADDPSLLAAARELALSCRFAAADLPAPGSLFPKLPLPSGETAYDRLYRMTQEGLRQRYTRVTREITQRLACELEQIDSMGFTDYFVVVGDICAAARAQGIPTVGRGSGASSLVSYLLGITNVDPLRYRLTFERFLHRLRRDLPDLDIDLCWRRRDDVIRHVYETYGADRVAMISTHNHYQSRGAFREAGKALGMTSEQVDRVARAIPSFTDEEPASALQSTPLGRRIDASEPPLPEVLETAGRLMGLPHTLGIHCGGIVIGPGPLDTWVPLEMATKGIVVTQYEMNAVEAVGLVKIDLLGNRALSTIAETITTIRATGGTPPDLAAIPDPDPHASKLLERGDTLGCFQIESPGMRNLLKMLGTHDLDGTIAALSLIRPGPAGSGMKERFVRRARGAEQTTYLHPSLEPLLAGTHGVLLYEEDVICVASAIGGFDRAGGDLLRRAIASATAVAADPSLGERPASVVNPHREDPPRGDPHCGDPWRGGTMRELENRFIACAVQNGIDADIARQVWTELARFGSYAFCKAHASGYGALAYQTTYLKANHAGPFYASLFNNHQGMYPLWVHVEDARRHGIPLAAPCVRRPAAGWRWDGERLSCGLGQIRNLSSRTLDAILTEGARDPFEDLDDLLARVRPSVPEAASLILCGALDGIEGGPRPAKLWRLYCRAKTNGPARAPEPRLELKPNGSARRDDGPWKEYERNERVRHELATLGIAIGAHPVAVLSDELAREGRLPSSVPAGRIAAAPAVPAGHAPARDGPGRIAVMGLPAAARRVRTKRGEPMLFLTLDDPSGLIECTLFPAAYARFGHLVREGSLLLATGAVEAQHGAPTLNVVQLERVAVLDNEAFVADPDSL